jgi:hypothetical protein
MSKVRAKSAIIFLLAALLLVTLWVLLHFGRPAARSVAAVPPPAGAPRASRPAAKQPPTGVAADSAGPSAAQVCGHAELTISDDVRVLNQLVGALSLEAGERWLSALQNSGDLRARAAGLLLEGKLAGGAPLSPVAEANRETIVQLAVGTSEPAVYAVALDMCASHPRARPGPECRQLSAQRWTQLDPGNAVPWLLLAEDAHRRHDMAGEADAFAHAAGAAKVDSYSDSIYAFAAAELPPDVTPLQRAYLATEVIGVEAAVSDPHYAIAARHCTADALRDTDVRQQCNALAELLVSQAPDLLDQSVGKLLGTKLGWSAERIAQIAQQQDAMMEAIQELSPIDDSQSWSCTAVARLNAYLDQRVLLGEVAAANELLERSGARIPEMAHKYRQFLKAIRDANPHQ